MRLSRVMGTGDRNSPDNCYIGGLGNNQNSWRRLKGSDREVLGIVIIQYKMCLNILREYLFNQGTVLAEEKKTTIYRNQDNH